MYQVAPRLQKWYVVDFRTFYCQLFTHCNLSQVSPAPSATRKLRKVLNAAWSGLETALRLLEKSADACPPLKSAVGGLLACINLAEVSHQNWEIVFVTYQCTYCVNL